MVDYAGADWGVWWRLSQVRNASWMRESHDSTIEVDDTGRAVNCDPQPSADDVDLVSVVRVRGEVGTVEPVCFA